MDIWWRSQSIKAVRALAVLALYKILAEEDEVRGGDSDGGFGGGESGGARWTGSFHLR